MVWEVHPHALLLGVLMDQTWDFLRAVLKTDCPVSILRGVFLANKAVTVKVKGEIMVCSLQNLKYFILSCLG